MCLENDGIPEMSEATKIQFSQSFVVHFLGEIVGNISKQTKICSYG